MRVKRDGQEFKVTMDEDEARDVMLDLAGIPECSAAGEDLGRQLSNLVDEVEQDDGEDEEDEEDDDKP